MAGKREERRGLVNRAGVFRRWVARAVAAAAFVGVFSYSLYLTHELVLMQTWRVEVNWLSPILNSLLIVIPATIAFAWVFYRFCEKPYMRKKSEIRDQRSEIKDLRSRDSEEEPDFRSDFRPLTSTSDL